MRLKPSFPKNSTRLASVRGPGMAARLRGPCARPPACDTPGRPAPLSSARARTGSPEPAGRGCPASQPPRSPLRPAAGLGRAFRIRSSRAIAIPCVGRFEQFCFEGCSLRLLCSVLTCSIGAPSKYYGLGISLHRLLLNAPSPKAGENGVVCD